jgi:hypothetical protein
MPFESSINKEWRKTHRTYNRPDPAHFTINGLVIPDGDFGEEDLAFLADDEADE